MPLGCSPPRLERREAVPPRFATSSFDEHLLLGSNATVQLPARGKLRTVIGLASHFLLMIPCGQPLLLVKFHTAIHQQPIQCINAAMLAESRPLRPLHHFGIDEASSALQHFWQWGAKQEGIQPKCNVLQFGWQTGNWDNTGRQIRLRGFLNVCCFSYTKLASMPTT